MTVEEMAYALIGARSDFGPLLDSAVKAHRRLGNQVAINDCQEWATSINEVLTGLGPFLENYQKLLKTLNGSGDHNAQVDTLKMKRDRLNFLIAQKEKGDAAKSA